MSDETRKDSTPCDYEVGYGRPPRNSQWKRGQSGNPGGQPKQKSLHDEFRSVLRTKITITKNGKQRRITTKRALAEKLYMDAMQGQATARKLVVKTIEAIDLAEKVASPIVITARPVLEDEPPYPVRDAIEQIANSLKLLGPVAPEDLRSAFDGLVSHFMIYYPSWTPRAD